jgi:hypothetical protein
MKNRESPENVNNNMENAPFAVISIPFHYLFKVPFFAFTASIRNYGYVGWNFFLLLVKPRMAPSVKSFITGKKTDKNAKTRQSLVELLLVLAIIEELYRVTRYRILVLCME